MCGCLHPAIVVVSSYVAMCSSRIVWLRSPDATSPLTDALIVLACSRLAPSPSTPANISHAGASPSEQGTGPGPRLLAAVAATAAAAAAALQREPWAPLQDGGAAAAVAALAERRRAALPTRASTMISMSTYGGGGGGGTASAAGAATTHGGSSVGSRWDQEEGARRRGQGQLGRGRASSRVHVYPNELYDITCTDGEHRAVTVVAALEGSRGQTQQQREERQQGMGRTGVVVSAGGPPLGSRGRRVAELVARNQRVVEQLGARQRQ